MSSVIRRGWFQIAAVGVALFVLVDVTLKFTQNPNYIPAFIMLGSLIVPAAFAAYFYRQDTLLNRDRQPAASLILVSSAFVIGGWLSFVIVGILRQLIPYFSILGNFLVASAIVEAATLIFPVVMFVRARHRREIDGLLFGIASGIGYTTFETMGTGLVAFTHGGITGLEAILLGNGLLSPLGQAAWTGFICAAIWHYQKDIRKLVLMASAYFLLAVALRFAWDLADNAEIFTDNPALVFLQYPVFIIIGGAGLFLVFRHLRHLQQKNAIPGEELNRL